MRSTSVHMLIVGVVVASLLPTAAGAHARGGDGEIAIVTPADRFGGRGDGRIELVDPDEGTVRAIPLDPHLLLDDRQAIAAHPDGQHLIGTTFTPGGSIRPALIDVTTGQTTQIAVPYDLAEFLAVSPDGSKLVLDVSTTSRESDLVVINADGTEPQAIDLSALFLNTDDVAVDFAPDNQTVYGYSNQSGGALWRWTPTAGAVDLTPNGCNDFCLSFSYADLHVDSFERLFLAAGFRSLTSPGGGNIIDPDTLDFTFSAYGWTPSPSETRSADLRQPSSGRGFFEIVVTDWATADQDRIQLGTSTDELTPTDVVWLPDGPFEPLGSPVIDGVNPTPPPPTDGGGELYDGDADTVRRLVIEQPAAGAVAVSQLRFPDDGSAEYVVISRDDVFADSLAGAVLLDRGPLLFSAGGTTYDSATTAELQRVLAPDGVVIILGGDAAVAGPPAEYDGPVLRLAGGGRSETAAVITRHALGRRGSNRVFLAAEGNWPDAVAAGAVSARRGIPLLLTPVDGLPAPTQAVLADHPDLAVSILGGQAVVGAGVEEDLRAAGRDVERLAGSFRIETALRVADAFWTTEADPVRQLLTPAFDDWTTTLIAAGYAADRQANLLLEQPAPCPGSGRPEIAIMGPADFQPDATC